MLLLSETLRSIPIMSLQTGGEIARTTDVIIDPRSLRIVALYVTGPLLESSPSILHTDDIRELGEIGIIIDDSNKLMSLDGLVRLQEIIDFKFDISRCIVHEKSGKKVGQVRDFSYEPSGYTIQQLYVHGSLLRSLTTTSHIVHRSQIIAIDHHRITIDSPTMTETIATKAENVTAFVNPFRSTSPQPDQTDT